MIRLFYLFLDGNFHTLNCHIWSSNIRRTSPSINSMVGIIWRARVEATNHQTLVFLNKSQNSSFTTHTHAFHSHLYFWYMSVLYLLLKPTFEFLQANILRDHFSTQLTFKWLYLCLFILPLTLQLSINSWIKYYWVYWVYFVKLLKLVLSLCLSLDLKPIPL